MSRRKRAAKDRRIAAKAAPPTTGREISLTFTEELTPAGQARLRLYGKWIEHIREQRLKGK